MTVFIDTSTGVRFDQPTANATPLLATFTGVTVITEARHKAARYYRPFGPYKAKFYANVLHKDFLPCED